MTRTFKRTTTSRPQGERSTFKQPCSLNVERWKLKVERSPIQISSSHGSYATVASYLRTHLEKARLLLKSPLIDLSIALVGDRKMAGLHQQFLGIPGPTDVLTFPLEADSKGRTITGEVVICVPEACRRCRKNGGQLREEVLLYALHGLLHLRGFDDRTGPGFQRMHRKEDEILEKLGVGRVFERG